jgi:hypothetical protein
MKPRKCKNWLQSFLDWTMPVSEASEKLLTWTALFTLSAVLKKKVRFDKDYTKHYDIYPTTYVMFVGLPGAVRKSTSAGYGQDLLETLNESLAFSDPAYINIGPTSGSHVAIIEKMSKTIDGSIVVIAGEFGNIVSTMPDETYDLFAKMFDTDKTAGRFEHSTRAHKDEIVVNPSLNLLGCTTPDWMMENTGYMVGGGFAARTIFVFESQARQRHLFYKNVGPGVEALEKMKKNLVIDLKRIGSLKGGAKPESEDLAKKMEDWYLGYIDQPTEKGTETFQARKHIHTLKTALVLSVCERDDLIITEEHFDKALSLIDDVERNLSRGLTSLGKNPYAGMLYEILDYIKAHSPVKRSKVVSYFFQDVPLDEMEKILELLKTIGEIERVDTGVPDITLRVKT